MAPTSKPFERLVRKQILITAEQARLIKAKARANAVPEAEVIRAAIDRDLGYSESEGDWKRQLMPFAGALEDEAGLMDAIASVRADWSQRGDAVAQALHRKSP
jgi:hypothetical protein